MTARDQAYTDTDWIGRVRQNWKVERMGRWFQERSTTVSALEYQPLSVTMQGIVPQLDNVAKTNNEASRKLVLRGDFAINSRSDRKGSSGISPLDGSVSVITTVLELRGLNDRFVHHLLRSEPFQEEYYRRGNGIVDDLWSTKWSAMKSIMIPVPPAEEQVAIADYLDRETAQIDAFIAKNEELIALLTERREAIIERAIQGTTRQAKLGTLLQGLKDGTHGSFSRVETSTGRPLLGARNIQNGQVHLDGQESEISSNDHRSIVSNGFPRRGDVLLVIVGATIGKSAIFNETEPMAFQRSVAFLRTGPLLDPAFLWIYSQSRTFSNELWLRAKTSAQPGVYLSDVSDIPVSLPSLDEQRHVVQKVISSFSAIDKAQSAANRAIDLARERRAALISAAVTGKIDVSKEAVAV